MTGAAYSGKSDFAPSLLHPSKETTVLGTGTLTDPLFQQRLDQLKKSRPPKWSQIDIKDADLIGPLELALGQGHQVIIDSINQWIALLLMKKSQSYTEEQLVDLIIYETKTVWQLIKSYPNPAVLVTSEVGAGISPPQALSRLFRMILGRCNRLISQDCPTVIAMMMGFPVPIKYRGVLGFHQFSVPPGASSDTSVSTGTVSSEAPPSDSDTSPSLKGSSSVG